MMLQKLFRSPEIYLWLFLFCYSPLLRAVDAEPATLSPVVKPAFGAEKFLKGPAPNWIVDVEIPAAQTSVEPNTLRLGDSQFRWDDSGETAYIHRVLQANNAGGVQAVGQFTLEFNPVYQVCTLHTLRILRGDSVIDKLNTVSARFLERELGLEQSIYTGSATVALLIDDVRVGDALEIAYSIKGTNPVFRGAITESAAWETTTPIQLRRVSLQFQRDKPVAYRFMGSINAAKNIKPAENTRDGLRELVFEQHNLEPVRFENFYPPGYQPITWLQISEYKNWNQVARWAYELFQTAPPTSELYKAEVLKLSTIADPAVRASAALDFAQTEIRYTSISFGENSHRPATPDDVLQRRYGDCKDKTLLLVSLLQAVGLNAKPVILSMGAQRGLNDWLPTTNAFDHAIVKLDLQGKTYWLDPTAQQQPKNLNTLGKLHGGSDVLVVDTKTERLTLIEQFQPDLYSVRERVHLDNLDGPATLVKSTTATGAIAETIRRYFAQTGLDEIKKNMLNEVQYVYTQPEWIDEPVIVDDVENNSFTFTGNYRLKQYVEKYSDGLLMRHKPVYISEFFTVPDAAKRLAPYALKYPISAFYSHVIEFPENVSISSPNEEKNITDTFFSLRQVQKREGRNASAEYTFSTLSQAVAPQDMERYISDIRRVQQEMRASIFVENRYVTNSLSEIEKYRQAAEKGDVNAQVELGMIYVKGRGVPSDAQVALQWWRKAAMKGSAIAQFDIGLMYIEGVGVEKDFSQAATWFRKASDQNFAAAQYRLAQLILGGKIEGKSKDEAVQLLSKAAEQGEASAQYSLAYLYAKGSGVPKDIDIALSLWRKSADQGNADAQNALGVSYQNGLGVARDDKVALDLYRKAAGQNNTKAQSNLGTMYYYGTGVEKNYEEALTLWQKAAKQGEVDAQYYLGTLYSDEQYPQHDYREAMKWWLRAGTRSPGSLNCLGVLAQFGLGMDKDLNQAIVWYRQAAALGYGRAQYNLGRLYSEGPAEIHNLGEAYLWFVAAENSGFSEAAKKRLEVSTALSQADLADAQKHVHDWQPRQVLQQAREAKLLQGPQPEYPTAARRLGEEGYVYLDICVNSRGIVEAVEVSGTSGFDDLDSAAVEAARHYIFDPAHLGEIAVPSQKIMKINFKLKYADSDLSSATEN